MRKTVSENPEEIVRESHEEPVNDTRLYAPPNDEAETGNIKRIVGAGFIAITIAAVGATIYGTGLLSSSPSQPARVASNEVAPPVVPPPATPPTQTMMPPSDPAAQMAPAVTPRTEATRPSTRAATRTVRRTQTIVPDDSTQEVTTPPPAVTPSPTPVPDTNTVPPATPAPDTTPPQTTPDQTTVPPQ